MKRLCAMIFVLLLVLENALAAGKLTVTQETVTAVPAASGGSYVYVFADVVNSGDKPVRFGSALMEVYDAEGNALGSGDGFTCYPDTLAPGAAGVMWGSFRAEKGTVSDHTLTVTGKSVKDNPTHLLPCTVRQEGDTLYAVVENDAEFVRFGVTAVFTLRDAEGRLVWVQAMTLNDVGLPAGGSVMLRRDLRYDPVLRELGGAPLACGGYAYAE